jgi:hypothetical protein
LRRLPGFLGTEIELALAAKNPIEELSYSDHHLESVVAMRKMF